MTTAKYPARAARAIAYLKSHSNDIDIFVEDTSGVNMWMKIIKKYISDGTKLKSVTPLGGRKEVLAACRLDQGVGGRKRLYIIDADIDILLGNTKPRLRHLYRLRRYCIENYLIDQSAIVEVMTSLNPRVSEADALSGCDVKAWFLRNRNLLRKLFISYGVAIYLEMDISTVSYSCYRLILDSGEHDLCVDKIRKRIVGIYIKSARLHGVDKVRRIRNAISDRANKLHPQVFCSGKDYIIPMLFEHAKKKAPNSATKDVFKVMLGSHANPKIDPFFRRRLESL